MMNDAMAATLPSARKEEDYGPAAVSWKLAGVRDWRLADVLSWVKRSARLAPLPAPAAAHPHAPRVAAATARGSSTLRRAAGRSTFSTLRSIRNGSCESSRNSRGRGRAPARSSGGSADGCGQWRLLHLLCPNGKPSAATPERRPGVHWYCGNGRRPRPRAVRYRRRRRGGGDEWDADAWTGWNAGGDAAPRRPNRRPRPRRRRRRPRPPAPPAPAPLMLKIGERP